jgi:DNA-binding NarL/FixJ family response regulator
VVLMDLWIPTMGGVEAIRRLRADEPGIRVLVLTTYDTESDVLPAIEAGTTGCLLKDAPREDLIRAVRAAAEGQPVLAPTVAQRLMTRLQAPAPAAASAETLTDRELEVVRLVA